MALRIIHCSDWHGEYYKLPEADMYIVTGDMLQNYPNVFVKKESGGWGMNQGYLAREIDPEKEERLQLEWFKRKFESKGRTLRHFFGSPDAPVVVVRGNHDYIDLAPLFGGEVFEVTYPSDTVEYHGLRIGGFRGINYIAGEWSDEKRHGELAEILHRVPKDLDIIVSHAPPLGIMDDCWGEKVGVSAFTGYINECMYDLDKTPKLFCFGHIHHANGIVTWEDGTIFSNAATTHNVIDLEV